MEIDHRNPARGFEILGQVSQVFLPMFDVVQDVVHEGQIEIADRQVRIGELTQHRLDVGELQFTRALGDVIDQPLLDVHGIDCATGRDCLRQGRTENARAGPDVRDPIARLQLQLGDRFVDLEIFQPVRRLQDLDPRLGRTSAQLGLDGHRTNREECEGQANRRQQRATASPELAATKRSADRIVQHYVCVGCPHEPHCARRQLAVRSGVGHG